MPSSLAGAYLWHDPCCLCSNTLTHTGEARKQADQAVAERDRLAAAATTAEEEFGQVGEDEGGHASGMRLSVYLQHVA